MTWLHDCCHDCFTSPITKEEFQISSEHHLVVTGFFFFSLVFVSTVDFAMRTVPNILLFLGNDRMPSSKRHENMWF